MAINILDETRRPGTPLGVRIDDAVRARRAVRSADDRLRMVPPAPAMARNSTETTVPQVRRPVRSVVAPMPCDRVRPVASAPTPAEGAPARPAPARAPRSGSQIDPMFDADVEQARRLATNVRGAVRRAERPNVSAATEPAPAPRFRLTLRGQRVLVALGFAVSIALGGLVGTLIGTEPLPEQTATVVVKPGDSLWTIAESVSGSSKDLRPVMEQIASLNGLQTSVISAGQTLVVPAE